jgi:Thiamine pyrophosphate enzyme, C-terminal TPP binding domain
MLNRCIDVLGAAHDQEQHVSGSGDRRQVTGLHNTPATHNSNCYTISHCIFASPISLSLPLSLSLSWFIGQEMKLPEGATYHFQMQYGSIGWATGATLGVAMGAGMYLHSCGRSLQCTMIFYYPCFLFCSLPSLSSLPSFASPFLPFLSGSTRRVISIIGDGSFQLTAQEVATMIRQRIKACIFIMNNRSADSVCLSFCLCVLSVCLSVCQSLCSSVCLFVSLSICLSSCLPVSVSVSVSFCPCICQRVCLSVCTVLYCTVLHCIALYCTVLHCTVLTSTSLHCATLH